ncbi:MAG: hypothetical protein OEQ53_22885 [Saprospiraceae bacterium]|nr:hypothetical protein [Saprospiraceae bacterium]
MEGRYYLLKLESLGDAGYTFIKEEVQIGRSSAGFIEIISEKLKTLDQVLVQGAYEVMPQ